MHVGVCRFTLLVPGSHSLKEKRSVLRRVKDRVRDRFGVALAEVGGAAVTDTWQRADLAFALVSGEREHARQGCEQVLRQVGGVEGAQVAAARIEVIVFGEDWFEAAAHAGDAWAAKTGAPGEDAGDRAEDLSWVPEEWLRERE